MGGERLIPLAQRYRLLSVVGKGGMGTVWRAHDEMLDRDVAVKEVHLPMAMTDGERRLMCRRLIDEARATAALRHPGVVALHDVIIEDGRPWIVMEYLRARSLHQVLAEDGPLSPYRAAEVGYAILAVLRSAHEAGILHRDVKPSNILLCDDGRVLLTDFGLAVHAGQGDPGETLVAGIEGSPAYLPPERVLGGTSVEASDLWSLGATLYAAVEGRSPFLRCHALASMVAVLLGEYDRPAAGPLADVIDGLLRQAPGDRLSPARTERLLRGILRRPRPVAEAPPVRGTTTGHGRGARRRRRTAISVATIAVMVIVFGAWTARWNSVGQSESVALLPVPGSAPKTTTYHEGQGYAVDVPAGWRREERGGGVQWNDPQSVRGLRITPVAGDPMEGLKTVEREVQGSYPGYRKLRLESVPELAEDAAEWEFTWTEAGGTHGLRSRAVGFEFYFFAPDSRWTPGQRLYDKILESFRPDHDS